MVYCSVKWCNSDSRVHKKKKFFNFPRAKILLEAFVKYCSNKNLNLTEDSRICEDHFESTSKQLTSLKGDICSVTGCNNTSWDDKSLHFFVFPQVKHVREKWIEFCKKNINWQPTKFSRICDAHFNENLKDIPKDKWIPTITSEFRALENKSGNDNEQHLVVNTQKIIKISGLKKLQIIKTLPEKTLTHEPKTEISNKTSKKIIEGGKLFKPLVPMKLIQPNKIKPISSKNLLKFDYSINVPTTTLDENIRNMERSKSDEKSEDSFKVIHPLKLVSPKNVIKLTTPINTIKNISIPIVTNRKQPVPTLPIKISNIRLSNAPIKVLKLPQTSSVEGNQSNDKLMVTTSKVKKESLNSESISPAPKRISAVSSTGKKITLTPIAISQKTESNKQLQAQRFLNINQSSAEKRSIQFIPVGYQPPIKIKRFEGFDNFKTLSLNEMVNIINKSHNKEMSIDQLAIKYKCSQKQVQQIITDHNQILVDGQRYLSNSEFLHKDKYKNNDLYKMILENIIGEWYYRSKCKGNEPTDEEILEKGSEVIQLFDSTGIFNSKMMNVEEGWPSHIRNSNTDKACIPQTSNSDNLIDIIFDLKDNLTYDLYNAILVKRIAENVSDATDDISHLLIDQDDSSMNGIFNKHNQEEISTYEDAYIHLLALIKFCKSIGQTESIKHLHNLKDFLIEEMCNEDKK